MTTLTKMTLLLIGIAFLLALHFMNNIHYFQRKKSDRTINYYTLHQFANTSWMFPLVPKLCVKTKGVEPGFTICTHEPAKDIWVSQSIVDTGYWEPDMAQWLTGLIKQVGLGTLYIDLGANLGIHGLHAAKSNCTVWIVEPQEMNLHKVIHSSIFSGVLHKMTFVKNAVDRVRHLVRINVANLNNGGSVVQPVKQLNTSAMAASKIEVVQTVLLSDIFHEALRQAESKNVIIKADIETYECRTFLQSPQVFEHPTLKGVVFEWFGVTENCSAEDFKKVLYLMRKNSFKLYQQQNRTDYQWIESAKSDSELLAAKGANLFWSKFNPS